MCETVQKDLWNLYFNGTSRAWWDYLIKHSEEEILALREAAIREESHFNTLALQYKTRVLLGSVEKALASPIGRRALLRHAQELGPGAMLLLQHKIESMMMK